MQESEPELELELELPQIFENQLGTVSAWMTPTNEVDDQHDLTALEEAISHMNAPSDDYYAQEGLEASDENHYFTTADQDEIPAKDMILSSLPLKYVRDSLKNLCASVSPPITNSPSNPTYPIDTVIEPTVYLTDDTLQQRAIDAIVSQFSLNTEQARAF